MNTEKTLKKNQLDYLKFSKEVVEWLKGYITKSKTRGFVMGVSGGIDSAVVSTLCAKTNLPLLILEMPIHQSNDEVTRSKKHIQWLKENFPNVDSLEINLTDAYDVLYKTLELQVIPVTEEVYDFSMANTRSRLRMLTLYNYAGTNKLIVAGTGNKVEDFGIGFYTKYGDGGVDISPIGDLMKSEVYELGRQLDIIDEILTAAPTDGLHGDGRTDEDQIGATYDELEWAMEWIASHYLFIDDTIENRKLPFYSIEGGESELTDRQYDVLEIYRKFNTSNKHKMDPIPVFQTDELRS